VEAQVKGKLVVCATPIGNLGDMSQRAISTLTEAHVIACEDTRRTRKLLTHFGIQPRELLVYNDANERRQHGKLLDRIRQGATVVLVSDAGMPGLSDPGYRLVAACGEEGFEVTVVPGPNAAISALAISGLPPARFVFEGFLPRKSAERRRRIEELKDDERTLVLYEAPHRVAATLDDLAEILGPRPAAVARELTKMHEEVLRGTLEELAKSARELAPRGEIVIVIEGTRQGRAEVEPAELASRARALMDGGVDRKDALSQVARESGMPRRAVFEALLDDR
jgi:16S rRNA (cytidine1402-2'-O)-methyltransferase